MFNVNRVIAPCVLGLAIGSGPIANAQEASASQGGFSLDCQVQCSETKLRTGIAILTWTAPQGRGGANALAGGSEAASIDVSVFANGLEEGRYVSFEVFKAGAVPRAPRASALPRGGRERRGLRAYDLKVGAAATGESVKPAAASSLDIPPDADRVAIEIENLEPGLNYSFRLRPPNGGEALTVMCVAPVCPADMHEGPRP